MNKNVNLAKEESEIIKQRENDYYTYKPFKFMQIIDKEKIEKNLKDSLNKLSKSSKKFDEKFIKNKIKEVFYSSLPTNFSFGIDFARGKRYFNIKNERKQNNFYDLSYEIYNTKSETVGSGKMMIAFDETPIKKYKNKVSV